MVKVGDKIRITEDEHAAWPGTVVEVADVNDDHKWVMYYGPYDRHDLDGDDGGPWSATFGNFELVQENVSHPAHYGGEDNVYEVIKVAEAWGLDKDAYLFNTLKYIARAGKKSTDTLLEDLKKGDFYLDRRIAQLETR